jgi:phenylacetate-CoA ligase
MAVFVNVLRKAVRLVASGDASLLAATYLESRRAHRRQFSGDAIESVADANLRAMVAHAYEKVPYYRNLLKERGISPEDISSPECLRALPTMRREVLQREFTRLLPESLPRCRIARSSGSTGAPTVTLQSRAMRIINSAVTRRAYRTNGLNLIGERFLRCLSGVSSPQPPKESTIDYRFGVYQGIYFTAQVFAHGARPKALLEELAGWKPTVVWGHALAIERIGEDLRRTGLNFKPKLIVTVDYSAEPFKRRLEDLYDTDRIVAMYGCYEAGEIAFQCTRSDGLHINTDYLCCEIMEGETALPFGSYGEVVISPYMNTAFPLFRYRLGDIAAMALSKCECGSKLPLLVGLHGRTVDCITLSNGTVLSPSVFIGAHGLLNSDIFRRYQVCQEGPDDLCVQFVRSDTFTSQQLRWTGERLREALGEAVQIRFLEVGEIAPDASGKYRFIRALVVPPASAGVGPAQRSQHRP